MSLVMIASGEPLDIVASGRRALEVHAATFAAAGVSRVEDIAATRALTLAAVRALAGDAPVLSDDRNPLGLGLGQGLRTKGLDAMLAPYDSLVERSPDLEPMGLARRLAAMNQLGRIGILIESLDEPERETARGWLAHERGQVETAHLHFERALELEPSLQAARLGLLATGRDVDDSTPLTPQEAVLVDAARAGSRGEWDAVRELDPLLSQFLVADLTFPEAARLRVDWRLASGSPRHAAAAIELIDAILRTGWRGEDLLRRARAAAQADRSDLAWEMLRIVATRVPNERVKLRREALEFSQTLPENADAARIRDALRRRATRPTTEIPVLRTPKT
jgi:hypothetical protein